MNFPSPRGRKARGARRLLPGTPTKDGEVALRPYTPALAKGMKHLRQLAENTTVACPVSGERAIIFPSAGEEALDVLRRGQGFVLGWALVLAALAAAESAPHSAYLHARTDLRVSQVLLRAKEQKGALRHLHAADLECEAAIHEIDHAAVLDEKELDDHPAVDASLERAVRFGRILNALKSSREELEHTYEGPPGGSWRGTAIRHINEALEELRQAAVELKIDRELDF